MFKFKNKETGEVVEGKVTGGGVDFYLVELSNGEKLHFANLEMDNSNLFSDKYTVELEGNDSEMLSASVKRDEIADQGNTSLPPDEGVKSMDSSVSGHVEVTSNENVSGDTKTVPQYECHKIVSALKIAGISVSGILSFEEEGFDPLLMDLEWLEKHNPEVGGYLVFYKDGYQSYSPAKAFEEGYVKI